MLYIKVNWMHASAGDPVILYSELNAERWEQRKVEVFADGRVGYAGSNSEFGGTQLSLEPLLSLDEINSDAQFDGCLISGAEFQKVWEEATSR